MGTLAAGYDKRCTQDRFVTELSNRTGFAQHIHFTINLLLITIVACNIPKQCIQLMCAYSYRMSTSITFHIGINYSIDASADYVSTLIYNEWHIIPHYVCVFNMSAYHNHSFVAIDAFMFIMYSLYGIGFPFHVSPTTKLIIQSVLRLIMYAHSFTMSVRFKFVTYACSFHMSIATIQQNAK